MLLHSGFSAPVPAKPAPSLPARLRRAYAACTPRLGVTPEVELQVELEAGAVEPERCAAIDFHRALLSLDSGNLGRVRDRRRPVKPSVT